MKLKRKITPKKYIYINNIIYYKPLNIDLTPIVVS